MLRLVYTSVFRELFGNEDLDSKVEAVRAVSMLLQVGGANLYSKDFSCRLLITNGYIHNYYVYEHTLERLSMGFF